MEQFRTDQDGYDKLSTTGNKCIQAFSEFLTLEGITIDEKRSYSIIFDLFGLHFTTRLRISPNNFNFVEGEIITMLVIDENKEILVNNMVFDSIGYVDGRFRIGEFSLPYFKQVYANLKSIVNENKIYFPLIGVLS
jgi:hypothetical protein